MGSIFQKKQSQWLVFGVLASQMASAGPLIDGGTEHAIKANSGLLKSVIQMNMGGYFNGSSCSASLIARNVLMTAEHCVEDLAPGKSLGLNNDPSYEVVKVIKPDSRQAINSPTEIGNRDIALVLFKSNDYGHSRLKDTLLIRIPSPRKVKELSNRVLMAGYGLSSFTGYDTGGVLRAGYNRAISGGMKGFVDLVLQKIILDKFASYGMSDDSVTLGGKRLVQRTYKNVAGSKMSFNEILSIAAVPESAQAMPGDSGSALFAFDDQGNPYAVGVASTTSPYLFTSDRRIEVTSLRGTLLANIDVDDSVFDNKLYRTDQEMEAAISAHLNSLQGEILETLKEKSLVDQTQRVFQSFLLSLKFQRIAATRYTSTTTPFNYQLLAKGVKELIALRDQMKLDLIGKGVMLDAEHVNPKPPIKLAQKAK